LSRFLRFLFLFESFLHLGFHLRLVQSQGGGDLKPPGTSEVAVEVELLLQLGQLLVGEVGARHAAAAAAVVVVVVVVG